MNNKAPKYIAHQSGNEIPSTGEIIKGVIKTRKINKAALARLMGRNYRTITTYLKNDSIQTTILWELSLILKHNFFADMAALMPPDFAGARDPGLSAKDKEIAELKQTVARLQNEKDLLMEVIKVKKD